ncbi:discoidin domain-containing protein, partial [bacterium]|nr:discoidin domain-containing protein [bacterium]
MKNYKILVISILLVASGCRKKENSGVEAITSPGMGNNPSFDVIVTNHRPLLSVFNSKGGIGKRTYSMQLDTSDQFNSKDLIAYTNIPEETAYVTGYRVQEGNELKDGVRYYWRAKATDEAGNSSGWGQTRFYVDTESDKHFMNLVRVPVKDVSVSSGFNEKNNIDLDDPGQLSFWQSTPPGSSTQWVEFGFDKPTTLTRLWMLSNPASKDNRLIDFVWQMSEDKKNWKDIPETRINNNDTFRNIINFPPVKTQYLRLMINRWEGYAAQINAVTFYSPGMPPLPELPNRDYVLVVGNQENGYTFTELQKFIQGL